jgi:transketolase
MTDITTAVAAAPMLHGDGSNEQLSIDTIRTLSMDAVQKANSGHPGTPMALAPVGHTLWSKTQPTLADPGRPDDRKVLVSGDPDALEQHVEQAAIKPARRAVVDVLGHGVVTQPGVTKTKHQASIVAIGGFMVKQQRRGEPRG